jgi:hypothetical protein
VAAILLRQLLLAATAALRPRAAVLAVQRLRQQHRLPLEVL